MVIRACFRLWVGTAILGPNLAVAGNYAFLLAGGSHNATHDFGFSTYKSAVGLLNKHWQTNVFFSDSKQGKIFPQAPLIESLTKKGAALNPSTKAGFLDSLTNVKAGKGDQVFISIAAHGNTGGGRWNLGTGNDERIDDEDLEKAIAGLRQRGVRVGVQVLSCFSGDFSPERLNRLRGVGDGSAGPPACVFISSGKGLESEACMNSDVDPSSGKMRSGQIQSHTSFASFVSIWLAQRGGEEAFSALAKAGDRCLSNEKRAFDDCLPKAKAEGINLGPDASLKDVFRAARLCDRTMNFSDWTGTSHERGVEDLLRWLAIESKETVYAYSRGKHFENHVVHRNINKDFLPDTVKDFESVTGAVKTTTPYSAKFMKAARPFIAEYKKNLVEQVQAVRRYGGETKLDAPLTDGDRKRLEEALGSELVARIDGWLKSPNRSGGHAPSPNPSFSTALRREILDGLFELTFPGGPDEATSRRISAASEQLRGGSEAYRTGRVVVDLQARQHELFLEILNRERIAYDSEVANAQNDACADFTL